MSKPAPVLASPSSPLSAKPEPGPLFSDRLREATKQVHREAERTGVLADLIRGHASLRAYALLLRNLVPVYATLETAIETLQHVPLVAAFAEPGLRRLPRLVDDVEGIAGADWALDCQLLPEAEAYAHAIEAAAQHGAASLAAHAYARYLGDLSGGQILRSVLARTLSLQPETLSFYEFPTLPDPEHAKEAIRQALDALTPDGAEAERFKDEAIAAFRHNIALSEAVAGAASPV